MNSLLQCGQCTMSLFASVSGLGRDREEACPEDLRVLVDLEAAIELPELQSRFAPDTQVAIAARAEAETGLIQVQEEGWTGFSKGW